MHRSGLLAAMLVAVLASVACSSGGDSSASASASPGASTPDSGTCTDACCARPSAGTSCDATTATTCSWAAVCPGGLVVARRVRCEAGAWTSESDCPSSGGVDERGCPEAPPVSGTSCALSPSTNGPNINTCGYSLPCPDDCTGEAGCVPVRRSVVATCSGGVWQMPDPGEC